MQNGGDFLGGADSLVDTWALFRGNVRLEGDFARAETPAYRRFAWFG